jgi:hypothetical protein
MKTCSPASASADGKAPDEAFRVKIPGFPLRRYPNILVEVGYSETHPDLIEDARHWLCESNSQVLCVIIFCFKKPRRESDFSDLSKWKAFVEVYERYVHLFLHNHFDVIIYILRYSDPVRTTAEKLFDGPVQFVPILPVPPMFRLSLRHVLAADQIPDGTDPNSVEHFSITYDESDFSDAVTLMIEKKRTRDATRSVNNLKLFTERRMPMPWCFFVCSSSLFDDFR